MAGGKKLIFTWKPDFAERGRYAKDAEESENRDSAGGRGGSESAFVFCFFDWVKKQKTKADPHYAQSPIQLLHKRGRLCYAVVLPRGFDCLAFGHRGGS